MNFPEMPQTAVGWCSAITSVSLLLYSLYGMTLEAYRRWQKQKRFDVARWWALNDSIKRGVPYVELSDDGEGESTQLDADSGIKPGTQSGRGGGDAPNGIH